MGREGIMYVLKIKRFQQRVNSLIIIIEIEAIFDSIILSAGIAFKILIINANLRTPN